MANDYLNFSNLDSGYDVSPLLGGTANASGNLLSDYASIKNGSYGKLMKAYCARQEAEKQASASGDSAQKLTLMRSNADALKNQRRRLVIPPSGKRRRSQKRMKRPGRKSRQRIMTGMPSQKR